MLARQEDADRGGGVAAPPAPVASPLTSLHQRFLADMGIETSQHPPEVTERLARGLEMARIASDAVQAGTGGEMAAPDADIQASSSVGEAGATLSVSVLAGDVALTFHREFDYASGRLTQSFGYEDADGNVIQAMTETVGPKQVLETVEMAVSPEEAPEEMPELPPLGPDEIDDFADLIAAEGGGSQEGVGSFIVGAVAGDFGGNDSYSAIAGQTVVGFIPIAGQIADVRDLSAALAGVATGEDGAYVNVSVAAIGFVPGLDFLKGATRVGRRALREAAEESIDDIARSGLKHASRCLSKEAAQRAGQSLRELATGRIELIERLRQMHADPDLPFVVQDQMRRTATSIEDHLTPADLSGALRDELGVPVRTAGRGREFDHRGEVETALTSMENARERLILQLGHVARGSATYRELSANADAIGEMMRRTREFLAIR